MRYTVSSASDQLVSFMSLVSISGLVLGVAVLILVLSVMNGFERELRDRVLGVVPHGIVYRDGGFDDWRAEVARFERNPEVVAAAPFSEGNGLAIARGNVVGIGFYGIDPGPEKRVSIMNRFVIRGELESLSPGSFNAAIGASLAKRLHVAIGDKFTLVLPEAQLTLAGPLPRTRRFTVSALFQVGSDVDKDQVLINIDDANRLKRVTRVDAIRVRVKDLFDAPGVLVDLTTTSGQEGGLSVSSWMNRYGNLYGAIETQKTTMFLLLLMLVAVAAFNVVSNLVMTVDDKRSDIAILRTLGATPRAIMSIFVMHGGLVGTIGVALGVAIGVTVATYVSAIYRVVDHALHLGLMDEYFIHYLPSEVQWNDVMTVAVVSIAICLLATLYPAYRAAKAHPVEALAYDA